MRTLAVLLAFVVPASAADDERTLTIIPAKSLPAFESVSIYRSADVVPGKKLPKPLVELKFGKAAANLLKTSVGKDAIHVFAKPKDGIAVAVAEKLTLKPGQTFELKLGNLLGVVDVFQKDGFPKVERIVLTASDDAGPDEKGHVPVQIGSDYRVEMPVPEGFYAVWLVPANGARATRIEDRIRVLPGKIVRIGN